MKSDIQNVKKARELRLSGLSLTEISKVIGISRSTLSLWLKDIKLSNTQLINLKERISKKIQKGRLNASIILKANRIFSEKKVFDEAIRSFPKLIKDPFFILGLTLYWVKGNSSGTSFQFSSSDMHILNIMNKWIVKYFKIDENSIKKRKYDSFYRINISGIIYLRKMIAWQKLLIMYYNNV